MAEEEEDSITGTMSSWQKDTQWGTTTHSMGNNNDDNEEEDVVPLYKLQSRSEQQSVFENARNQVQPGSFFQFLTYLYAERKFVLVVLIHFVCTMVIWANFFLIKFDQQQHAVPPGANRYWLKRLAPPLEFGAMHALLFQMALLPLTMARLSIATASQTGLNAYFPFSKAQRIHIYLGYVFGMIVVAATLFFFLFFGLLCSDGEQEFCEKFKSEIMITGYLTVAFVLTLLGTSYFRDKMPYEVFYGIHHLVFLLYLVVILHTLDRNVRKEGQTRSQTFKWFSATLLYYLSDRMAMRLNHGYKTRVVDAKIIAHQNHPPQSQPRMILLQLRRPSLFRFEPGQYAHLQFPEIDSHWHPFSIGSHPNSNVLEFYIEVQDDYSWTGKLCRLLQENGKGHASTATTRVQVLGPYGTPLGNTHSYSHAMAIGSGSGVVPLLSLYKQHVCQLLRLDPQTYLTEQAQTHAQLLRMERAREQTRGSWFYHVCQGYSLRQPTRQEMEEISETFGKTTSEPNNKGNNSSSHTMVQAAKRASRPIYGVNLLMMFVVLGVLMLGLTLSWNELPFDLYHGMVEILIFGSFVFQFAFAVVAIGYWDRGTLLAYTDVLMVLASVVADWYWFHENKWGNFGAAEHVYYILLGGYMTARLWHSTVKPRHCSLRSSLAKNDALDKLNFVWTTRSATHVLKIVPSILQEWDALVAAWGLEHAQNVCQVSIYITDKDKKACDFLKQELSNTSLFQQGAFHFQRANLDKLLQDHAMERIYDTSRPTSSTLLAFCGSPVVSTILSKAKTVVDISTMITGNKYHQMDFVSESYSSSYTKKRPTCKKQQQPYSVFMDSPSFVEKEQDDTAEEYSSNSSFEDEGRLVL